VTNLINSLVLLACQVSLSVNRIFFQEVANFVTRRKKVVVTDVVTVPGGELGLRQNRILESRNEGLVIESSK
jgi:hypothetical protein